MLQPGEKTAARELINAVDVPQWHMYMVIARLEECRKYPSTAIDFDAAMDDIEKKI